MRKLKVTVTKALE